MRTLILALVASLLVSTGAFAQSAAPSQPASSAGATCPPPETTRVATYLNRTRAEVMATLNDAYRACDTAIGSEDNASAARAAYTPQGAAPSERLTPSTLIAMSELARQARVRANASCASGDSYVCRLDERIASRAELALLSGRALEQAYNEAPDRAVVPAETLDLDEFDVDMQQRRRLVLPGSAVVTDVFVGQSPAETGEGGQPPELEAISTCAYVFNGVTYATDCAVPPQQASSPSWNIRCDAACAQRAVDAAEAMRPAMATRSLYGVIGADTLMREEARLDAQNEAEWRAYFFGAGQSRVQWPWELMINGARYEAAAHRTEGGRWSPPTDALIVMHPGVGATFYDGDDSEVKLSAVAELIGYSRWRYRDGARDNEWGASVIAAYTPGDDGDDWGYGVLLRTPYRGLNVAWVRREGADGEDEDGVMLSMRIGDFFSGEEGLCSRFGVSVPGVCGD